MLELDFRDIYVWKLNQTVLELDFRDIYVWKLNQTVLELDFRAVKNFVLPSTGFEPTPLIHCSTIRLALRPAP